MAELLRRTGVKVFTAPVQDFMQHLQEKYADEETRDYVTRTLVHSNLFFEGASKTDFTILNRKTENILRALNFQWPELDGASVKLMVAHARRVGFL
jgi:hypothetical protein